MTAHIPPILPQGEWLELGCNYLEGMHSLFFFIHIKALYIPAETVRKGNANIREDTGKGGQCMFKNTHFYIASIAQQSGILITQLHASPLFQEHCPFKDNSNSVSDAIDLLWESTELANRMEI